MSYDFIRFDEEDVESNVKTAMMLLLSEKLKKYQRVLVNAPECERITLQEKVIIKRKLRKTCMEFCSHDRVGSQRQAFSNLKASDIPVLLTMLDDTFIYALVKHNNKLSEFVDDYIRCSDPLILDVIEKITSLEEEYELRDTMTTLQVLFNVVLQIAS